jgi:hypothetical protein
MTVPRHDDIDHDLSAAKRIDTDATLDVAMLASGPIEVERREEPKRFMRPKRKRSC